MKLWAISVFLATSVLYESTSAYKAGVFEHYAQPSDTPKDTILKNIEEYRGYADKAKNQSANIVVFPEYGLTGIVEDPEQYAIVVKDTDEIIFKLKVMAEERQLYMVVNLLEKEENSNSKTKYYNTDLVFDRSGKIILKYRKMHLFRESKLTPGDSNQTLSFTTDFGVTFGIFTGLDILFDNPSQRALEDSRVTDIVFPTSWISIMPFLTPLSVQHGYSLANGVNLLAANYGDPKNAHGGSGIYLADGKVAEIFISETKSIKPLIQEVTSSKREDRTQCVEIAPFGLPGQQNKTSIRDYVTKEDFAKDLYKYKRINLNNTNINEEICYDNFCCSFEIAVDLEQTTTSSGVYKLVAYDGPVSYDDYKNDVSVCALLVCENEFDSSCGARINGTTVFKRIKIKSNFTTNQKLFRPVSLNYYLQPILQTNYCFKNETNSSSFQFTTLKAQHEVLVFGVMGKVNGASAIHGYGLLLLVFYTVLKYFVL